MKFPPNKNDFIIKKNNENIKVLDSIINESINSFSSSLIIYKNNKKILDIKNKNDSKLIETLSITKSFCSLAIFFLIQDKIINSVNDLVSTYISAWKYGSKKDISIKHILTHTSGLDKYWNYSDFMYPNGKLDLFLKKKEKKPNVHEISLVIDKNRNNDKEWYYNDTAIQIIPTLVKKLTGKHIDKYLNNKLFKPLKIKFKWNKDDDGNPYGPNGLSISADDLCKIGLLFINKGKWNGERILNNNLINELLKKRISQKQLNNDNRFKNVGTGYGYLWWNYNNLHFAFGFLGQYLIIDLKKKIVAVRLLESKWENKKFDEETKKDTLYFNNFKKLIENIS